MTGQPGRGQGRGTGSTAALADAVRAVPNAVLLGALFSISNTREPGKKRTLQLPRRASTFGVRAIGLTRRI